MHLTPPPKKKPKTNVTLKGNHFLCYRPNESKIAEEDENDDDGSEDDDEEEEGEEDDSSNNDDDDDEEEEASDDESADEGDTQIEVLFSFSFFVFILYIIRKFSSLHYLGYMVI